MYTVQGFESDLAALLAAKINDWMAQYPEAVLISMTMAGTTTGHDSDHLSEVWGALVVFRVPS